MHLLIKSLVNFLFFLQGERGGNTVANDPKYATAVGSCAKGDRQG